MVGGKIKPGVQLSAKPRISANLSCMEHHGKTRLGSGFAAQQRPATRWQADFQLDMHGIKAIQEAAHERTITHPEAPVRLRDNNPDVIAVNNLNPRKPIRPRQVVLVPVGPNRPKRRPKLPASGPVHLVETGDTLWSIAQRYGTSVARLCRLNDMHPRERIHPGDRIILPQADTSRYLVKSGDTLIGIAQRHSVALKDLLLWNNLSPEKTLKPGTTLRLKPTGTPQDS